MNALKSILAASLFAGITSTSQAALYDTTGLLTGFTAIPGTISATFSPATPSFLGTWSVDPSSLSGNVSFSPYSVHFSVLGSPTGDVNYTADSYQLDTSAADISYDTVTRTLTISNGALVSTGSSFTCTGSIYCGTNPIDYSLDLSLTFSDDTLSAFTGTAFAAHGDNTGAYIYDLSFSGTAVPVPAAAWLFGSGLIGLAGVARRRSN